MVPPGLYHWHPRQVHSHLHEVLHLYEAPLVPVEKQIKKKKKQKVRVMCDGLQLPLSLVRNGQTLNIVSTTE